MMTEEEKTTNLDPVPREGRYYVLTNAQVVYQTDEVDDAVGTFSSMIAHMIRDADLEGKLHFVGMPAVPDKAPFDAPSVVALSSPNTATSIEDLAGATMLGVLYNVELDEFWEHQPELLKENVHAATLKRRSLH